MMKGKQAFLLLLSAGVILATVRPAEAIPGFARKYKFSCSTCHAPFPRLKAYGEEFAGRGFRLEDPSQEPRRATYDTGDTLLSLPRTLPLAVRMDGFMSYKEDALAESDVEFPWIFKLMAGGPITDRISYYFYYILERGESGKLEDAYVQFNSLFGLPVDVMAGQFQVSDPLFKRELRLERHDYLIYKTGVGHSRANLAYDRGFMFLGSLPGEIETVFQIVNGNGIDEADHDKNFDSDSHKNFGLRLTRSFGPLRIGAYGYSGKEEQDGRINRMTYLGPDLTVTFGERAELNIQYMKRTDDDPFFEGREGDDVETDGGLLEFQMFPGGQDGRWVISALYNNVESDDPSAEGETASLTLNYLLARNGKLIVEAGQDLHRESGIFLLGFVCAF